MFRKYYVTLCGNHFGYYAEVVAQSKENADCLAVKKFGILNVSNVYTEATFLLKSRSLKSAGIIENVDYTNYLKRKKIL